MEENTTLYEVVEETNEEATNKSSSGSNAGLLLFVGGLLGAAALKAGEVGVKTLKQVWNNHKAKKEQIVDVEIVEENEVEEVDSEDDTEE